MDDLGKGLGDRIGGLGGCALPAVGMLASLMALLAVALI